MSHLQRPSQPSVACSRRPVRRPRGVSRLGALALLGALGAVASLGGAGCSGAPEPSTFTNPRFNFGFVERVAVLPFENLSTDRQAGARATRLMITELLASGAVDVVDALIIAQHATGLLAPLSCP